jgi:hypothetical protein
MPFSTEIESRYHSDIRRVLGRKNVYNATSFVLERGRPGSLGTWLGGVYLTARAQGDSDVDLVFTDEHCVFCAGTDRHDHRHA